MNDKASAQLGVPLRLMQGFTELYEAELGKSYPCQQQVAKLEHKVCFESLRNEGNSPYILFSRASNSPLGAHPSAKVKKPVDIVVLFHGLSDSPFFMRGIAEHLQSSGYTVVVALSPGHGKRDAREDMKDDKLKERWYRHVDDVMALVEPFSERRFIGGFSTGGTLATRYALLNEDNIDGLLLFSAALALSNNAERLGAIWGMKSIAKLSDGEFVSHGPHPYRYPDVAGFAGLSLADVIFEIRDMLESGEDESGRAIDRHFPIFIAHSLADIITPYHGVDGLSQQIEGEHHIFTIAESYDTCHQDLVMSAQMMIGLKIDKQALNISERCAVPTPNPLFNQMMLMLSYFMKSL
ncbi:alpha/beta fold hydrolase [Glaciecola sp. MH2013]|nr:alpha/beta fold hydrolase [Glaciecola sp. MH2013]